jgi:tyrosinase
MDIRRNFYRLSPAEVGEFTAALNTLKSNGGYDMFIHHHHEAMMDPSLMPGETAATTSRNSAHRGPAFGPWHRYFLRDLELQLQGVTAGMTLPYWDWATDAALADPRAASLWSAAYIGGDGAGPNDYVPNGPFQNWTGLVMTTGMTLVPRATPGLVRRLGRDPAGFPTLPTATEVTNSLTEPTYDATPWSESQTTAPSFRNRLEGWLRRVGEPAEPRMHNRVHTWVGGDMLAGTSPNDPVFFLHHANVDRQWAQWQAAHAAAPYVPAAAGPPGHNLNDAMRDFGAAGITPASMLDHYAMGYMYDTEGLGFTASECAANAAINVPRGSTAQLQACFSNTGTAAWVRGTATQVNLVPAPLHTPSPFVTWASNWLSTTVFATVSAAMVAPGQTGFFIFAITPPAGIAPGPYVLEGELVVASSGVPVQSPTFRQVINVQ